ncbi:MAG: response regulator, partial [Pseudomonadales bacterium]|nr:response regulator [Pseudomonadales bacterium]
GIAPKIKAHIFKPFNQADSSFSRQYGGLGFGMSLSKALVETMGGTIHYDSATSHNSDLDNGTQITIQIPWKKGAEILSSHDSQSLTPAEGVDSTDSQPETALPVLIVEDNPVNQLLLKTIVIKLGYPVETANNGGEAIEICNKLSFCCILMDCQMPIIDGFEATRTIRAHSGKNSRTPIIAVTANAMSGDRERCLASGMTDYLKKPVSKSQLKRCIEASLYPETDT